MRFFRLGLVALASSVAVLAAAPAAAQTTSFAHLSGLNYELLDLTPNDGITSAITFSIPSNYFSGFITDGAGNHLTQVGEGNDLTAVTDSSQVYASITGDEMATAVFTAGGGTTNNEKYDALVRLTVSFTLTANTQVTFQALSSLSSTFDTSTDASATAGTYFAVVESLPTTSVSSHDISMNGVLAAPVSASFTNNSNVASAQRTLVAAAFAQGAGPSLSPVPEPETYAMLLAGLGLIGAAARRRKAQAANC